MRIGVAGLNGSGKTEVVRFLESRSFHGASLSDVIRHELEREGLEPSRENMIERGRSLRKSFGPSVLAERAVARLPAEQHCVLDSIRHPAEVAALRAAGPFVLLWIDAPDVVRFERVRRRGRAGDAGTLDAFLELESRELASQAVEGQKLLEVRALADEVIGNGGDLGELHAQIQALLVRVLAVAERPSWDDYFMSIARVVASRSNCIKRKVGAVVVVDRRIVSTGYNGTPRGVRNCNEGGCPRCAGVAESGTRLDECLCSHAEENGITQAAYHGVRVRDAVIYTTLCPCLICTKLIINAGIREVVYSVDFPHGAAAIDLFQEAGVRVRKL
jgi:dCMP deaminase